MAAAATAKGICEITLVGNSNRQLWSIQDRLHRGSLACNSKKKSKPRQVSSLSPNPPTKSQLLSLSSIKVLLVRYYRLLRISGNLLLKTCRPFQPLRRRANPSWILKKKSSLREKRDSSISGSSGRLRARWQGRRRSCEGRGCCQRRDRTLRRVVSKGTEVMPKTWASLQPCLFLGSLTQLDPDPKPT